MLYQAALLALANLTLHGPTLVSGHGYLKSPRSRNWYAHDIISTGECTGQTGCPPGEYCQHCLNTNDGVCGKSTVHNYETSEWLDKSGNPMPWISQGDNQQSGGTYDEGGLITIDSYLDTHHNGHMEIRACVVDDANPSKCTTPLEFEGNELHYVQDEAPVEFGAHPPMPPDPDYPERGMYAGGQGGSVKNFRFMYRLPEGIAGEKVLLQWRYITANSCSPPGYAEYFARHPNLPDSYWTQGVTACTPPYPNDGTRGTTWPEQFFNCGEITVLDNGSTPSPTISPKPTPNPTTASPTVSNAPTTKPVVGGPPPCLAEWADCTYDVTNCCEGHKCTQIDEWGNKHCLADTCNEGPTGTPPTGTPPTGTPPTGTPPTGNGEGCCTINLKTCHHEEGNFCRLSKENCEGPCGKLWLPTGPLEGCTALWEQSCSTDTDCCQHGECQNGSCESADPWLKDGTPTTSSPTKIPTSEPTNEPTSPVPTSPPTLPAPTSSPTTAGPTTSPTNFPTKSPATAAPTSPPTTAGPSKSPTNFPTKSPATAAPHGGAFDNTYSSNVRVNQVGYLRFATKVGVIVEASTSPIDFQVQDAAGDVVLLGTTAVYGNDGASGDNVHQADFSSLEAIGAYKLVVEGIGASLEFQIAPSLYPNLPHEAMNYFYFHRMGMEVKGQHLIDDRYARAVLHPEDTAVPPYPGWCATCDNFDLLGSWADAGDFGIYTVNHAISAWTLLNLHEMFPDAFVDGSLNLPESGNSFPDVLDEVDFGSRFVRGMLPSDGGLASHKAHNHAWSAFTITIDAENTENAAGTRSVMGNSSPATYAVARVNAQLARMWSAKGGNAAHVETLWNAAKDAWNRATSIAHKTYNAAQASPGPAVGGGDYPDGQVDDDKYAAACEMYLTAYALSDANVGAYKSAVQGSGYFTQMSQWDWATVTGAGTLSLYAVNNDLSEADKGWIEANIVGFADQIRSAFGNEGYPSNLNYPSEFGQYPWGSNSFIMNRMIALAYAYEITENDEYQHALMQSMDYIMGTNAMDISYVTGYGDKAETDTHDRWAWTIGQDAFWPKGWLSGGPNNELINDYETPGGVAAAKSYAGPGTAPHAWGSKENTVNWNAPLAWVSWYIENKVVPNLGGCGGNCQPLAKSWSGKLQMDTSIALTLSASDHDGTVTTWEIVDQPSMGTLSGAAPNLVYTPNTGAVGTDTFTFRVMDDSNQVSNTASVSLLIRDCDLIDIFQMPGTYPTFSGSFSYIHISEDGPSLKQSDMKNPAHNVQWQNPGLHGFSLELSVSPHYVGLNNCMSNQNLGGAEASFTLSGCGISSLDGDYWIKQDNGNEIWVEKNNGWAIIFTNDAGYTPEFCRTAPSGPQPTGNPTKEPTSDPTKQPTLDPTAEPTKQPTNDPTKEPTKAPTHSPTTSPATPAPTGSGPNPTSSPTRTPSREPTSEPSKNPTKLPTSQPSKNPTKTPTPPPTPNPTKNPTPAPTPNPTLPATPKPTSGGTFCCADRNTGYQQCISNPWCQQNPTNCKNCNGVELSVPLVRTGCCSWGGQDCSGFDPSTNVGCHYRQEDCEGNCNGNWQSFL